MKCWLFLLLILPFAIQATDKTRGEGELPFNFHEFNWQAESNDHKITLAGKGIDNTIRGALVFIRHRLNDAARAGTVPDGTEFTISLVWKEAYIERGGTARIEYPVEMRRGPDKSRETDRGPSPPEEARKNSDKDLAIVHSGKEIPIEIKEKLKTKEIPRGPNKETELPRGSIKTIKMKRE